MPTSAKYAFDGAFSFEGGVDAGRPPNVIGLDQVAKASNASFRGGQIRPRSKKVAWTFTNDDPTTDAMSVGLFQGAGGYTARSGSGHIFMSIDGYIYRFDLDNANPTGTALTDFTTQNAPFAEQSWFCQAEEFLIIQNDVNLPWIWNGITLSRGSDGQIPVGRQMAYGLGRLWVARGYDYLGGDLVGSNPALGTASILYFTENTFLNEGGSFRVPWQTGEITGLAFTAKQDAASGEGSLMVGTPNGLFEFDAPVDRTLWTEMQQPAQRFSLLEFGPTSQESMVNVNGDLFFRSPDGIRSFYFARRDFGQWGNTPISREIGPALEKDKKSLLKYASAVNFDNRLLMTVEPIVTARGVIHRKLAVLDFDLISGMRGKTPPAWNYTWDLGVEIFRILTVEVKGVRRCFIVGKNEFDVIGIWELLRQSEAAVPNEEVQWEIETRSFGYQSMMDEKRLQVLELWLGNVRQTVTVDSWYRKDAGGCWAAWARYTAAGNACVTFDTETCAPPRFPPEVSRSRIGFPLAPTTEDAYTCEQLSLGYEFQFKLRLNGDCEIRRLRTKAILTTSETYPDYQNACTDIPSDACDNCNA